MKFSEMNLIPSLKKAIQHMGYVDPTPIQEKCIPEILAAKDVVGQSLTGSGKTAAFAVPMLEKVVPRNHLQALVLTPTRELCVQVTETIEKLGKFIPINATAAYGGVGIVPQIEGIARSEILVATPGRMLDHIERGTVNLRNVRFLVIDEADKMFEMGFIEDVERIISQIPRDRQTLLFSATMSTKVLDLVRKHLRKPVFIKEQIHVDKSLLRQVYYNVRQNEKFSLLVHLLRKTPELAIVFCATRSETDLVATNLKKNNIKALAIHGGLTQNKRQHSLDLLKKEHVQVLVATDVAARGLDINNIAHVFNYDVPKTPEEYTHRIGRTARMGKSGEAITLLTERDYENFGRVQSDPSLKIIKEEVPAVEKVFFNRGERGHRRGGGDFQRGGFHKQGQGQQSRGRFQKKSPQYHFGQSVRGN